jgi:hypothetical protein
MNAGFFRQTPWLPWMRRGKSDVQGRLFANSHSYKSTGTRGNIPIPVREYLGKNRPDMLECPTDWEPAPIGSTWGCYAKVVPRENPGWTPAVRKPGG